MGQISSRRRVQGITRDHQRLAYPAIWMTSLALDPVSNIVAVNGTKEALFMAGDICVPRTKNGRRPAVLIPNPFYQVYVGTTVLRGAEPVYLSATKETGFLPDFENLDVDLLKRTALVFLCNPANPQGAIASLNYLKKAIDLARESIILS